MTPEQREALINKLIEDVVESASSDSDYACSFIEEAMRSGYPALSEKSDADLLQWHRDAFDEEYQP